MPYVLVNSKNSGAHFSITRDEGSENSSDLDRGRRHELKSDEISDPSSLVIEIISLLCEIVGRSSCTFWEPDPLEHLQFASSEHSECSCVVICLSVVSTRIWTVFRVFV